MVDVDLKTDDFRDLALLQEVEADPDVSQASLAQNLGVAIGTVNWHLKRLIDKGCIKVKRARRRKLRYIITPEGLALRANLTVAYIQQSFRLFHQVREQVRCLLAELAEADLDRLHIEGNGDIADVCRLTCMEQHFKVTREQDVPVLLVDGLDIRLEYNGTRQN